MSHLTILRDPSNATRPHMTAEIVESIRADVIAGYPTREISERHGLDLADLDLFLSKRRGPWLGERRAPFRIKRDRIILFRPRARPDGGSDIRPFSVPKISMHVAALREKN